MYKNPSLGSTEYCLLMLMEKALVKAAGGLWKLLFSYCKHLVLIICSFTRI